MTEVDAKNADNNGEGSPSSAKILVVIEDDPDVQFLIEAIFAMDPRFSVSHVAKSAEEALEAPPTSEPGIIVLDHGLAGPLPGLAAAPLLKERAPEAKIIMFTAHAALQARADNEPNIDAFLLKTESEKLLPLAQQLTGLGPPAA
jgi:DNA-binding NarL/FixJ family response regulator